MYFSSCSILDSTNTIFWSLFGQIDPSSFKISEAEYGVIWRTGMTLFGAFNITAVLVALNMLIAILNDSYVQITVSCILKKLVISSVSYMLGIFVGSSKHLWVLPNRNSSCLRCSCHSSDFQNFILLTGQLGCWMEVNKNQIVVKLDFQEGRSSSTLQLGVFVCSHRMLYSASFLSLLLWESLSELL